MQYHGNRIPDKLMLFYVRRVPDHPFKIRIINWINTAFFGDKIQVKSNTGSLHAFSTKEQLGTEIIFSDEFEPLTLIKCRELLKNGGNFIDIGANIGLHSLHLATIDKVNVFAIEPSPNNFEKLLSNIALNNSKNILPIHIGLADKDSFGYLVNDSPANAGTVKVVDQAGGINSYMVRLCTLAQLVNHLNLSAIELIKIDVEGFEMNIFKGFFGQSSVMPKNIIMEFTNQIERTGHTEADCFHYFKNLGYDAFTVTGEPYQLNDPLPEVNLWLKLNH